VNAAVVIHSARSTRLQRPASYSAQFVTLNFVLQMRWQRTGLCLTGMMVELDCFDNNPHSITVK
jgi:hypothetical protein